MRKVPPLESEAVRKALVGAGAMLGFLTLALPLFEQPTFDNPTVQYGLGLPLLIMGLLGRVYPMMYLRKKGTTTTLDKVGKLVDSGPYAWVRHPQYTAGLVMLLGWFLAWGAWYALCVLPFMAGIIYAQARVEEKHILEKMFGEAYAAYRERVGMLLPRLSEKHSLRITMAFLGLYAGLLAAQHGILVMLQGNRAPDSLLIHAIGPQCRPEAVWHACYPALEACDFYEAKPERYLPIPFLRHGDHHDLAEDFAASKEVAPEHREYLRNCHDKRFCLPEDQGRGIRRHPHHLFD
ncbi:MAG: isoprenylcysteine carboxylmethyltransferase family protein [Chloroflexi bacterium]|nr:isoprenylcysteine carboxylmethyltransferase family protein [Chloroflexota bacterium]